MKIVIRADSGTVMGVGHVMRCLVLADSLLSSLSLWERVRVRGDNIIFACRALPGNIIPIIESRGYKVKKLDESLEKANGEFVAFLKEETPEILIIDNYDTDISLESQCRPYVQKIIVIDDLANRAHDCDMLLDQNPCPETHARYAGLIPAKSLKLLGLGYALLGGAFAGQDSKLLDGKLKNILIFFGGGDHKNLTEETINSLVRNSQFADTHFNVVVGASNPNKDKIQRLCEANKNFTYHCQIDYMARLMQEADLFIGAGGTTSWERMCVGLPAIIISIADNQEEGCKELARLDLIKYLSTAEEFTAEKLLSTLEWINKNPAWLQSASKTSQKMVDGKGAKRVSASIISSLITFKNADLDDCENIYNWRNAAENRKYSINNSEIPFEKHQEWFAQIINDTGRNLLVSYYNDQPIGVVRFDYAAGSSEISIYLVPGAHGKGFGLPLLLAAERWLQTNNSAILQITAKVLIENVASVKIFERALYKETGGDKNILLLNKRLK